MPRDGLCSASSASSHALSATWAHLTQGHHNLFGYCDLAPQVCRILPIVGARQGINLYWGHATQFDFYNGYLTPPNTYSLGKCFHHFRNCLAWSHIISWIGSRIQGALKTSSTLLCSQTTCSLRFLSLPFVLCLWRQEIICRKSCSYSLGCREPLSSDSQSWREEHRPGRRPGRSGAGKPGRQFSQEVTTARDAGK